jgi:hypothetical protein
MPLSALFCGWLLMEMREKGLSDAQDRTDSSYDARPARCVYRVLSDATCRALAYFCFHRPSPDLGRAGAHVHAIRCECWGCLWATKGAHGDRDD